MIKFSAVALMLVTLSAGAFIAMYFLDGSGAASDEGTALKLSGPNDEGFGGSSFTG